MQLCNSDDVGLSQSVISAVMNQTDPYYAQICSFPQHSACYTHVAGLFI